MLAGAMVTLGPGLERYAAQDVTAGRQCPEQAIECLPAGLVALRLPYKCAVQNGFCFSCHENCQTPLTGQSTCVAA